MLHPRDEWSTAVSLTPTHTHRDKIARVSCIYCHRNKQACATRMIACRLAQNIPSKDITMPLNLMYQSTLVHHRVQVCTLLFEHSMALSHRTGPHLIGLNLLEHPL